MARRTTKKAAPKRKAASKKKTVKRAAPKKKTTAKAKKKTAAKAAPKKKAATGPVREQMTKTQLMNEIAENVGLGKKEVQSVLEELGNVIQRHIRKRSIGQFTLPGLLKIKAVKKPARPARKNVPNPFRPGEFMDVPAKPATMKVKVLPLKKLKEFALS